MPLVLAPAADRNDILSDGMSDSQTWKGWAREGNTLTFTRRNSANGLCWCTVDDNTRVFRFSQGGPNHLGHFGTLGESIIARRMAPNSPIRISFSPPIAGLAFEVDPRPGAVVPAQPFKVRCQFEDGAVTVEETFDGNLGTTCLIARRCTAGQITQITVSVAMIDAGGVPTPVDFAINKLDLIATDMLIS